MESSDRPGRGRSSPTGSLLWHQWVKAVLNVLFNSILSTKYRCVSLTGVGLYCAQNDKYFFLFKERSAYLKLQLKL